MQLLCFPLTVPRRSSDCSVLHQPADRALLGIVSGFKLFSSPLFFPFFIFFLISPVHFYIVSASHSAGTGQKAAIEKFFKKSPWNFIFMPKGAFSLSKLPARLDRVNKTSDTQAASRPAYGYRQLQKNRREKKL